jgi:alpha-tubulin suppressor-like RCC1 family protein
VNNNVQNQVITQIAVGNAHTIILTQSNQLYGWGLNNLGQIGDGTFVDKSSPTAVILTALLGKTIISIKARGDFNLALTKDGFVYSWGANNLYQLGDGKTKK